MKEIDGSLFEEYISFKDRILQEVVAPSARINLFIYLNSIQNFI
jgi:hypothetical protein